MPYLRLDTNLALDDKTTNDLLAKISVKLATILGKPESYVLTHVNAKQSMMLAASTDPLAYVELKSIALPRTQTTELSALICDFIGEELNIPANRIYIEFSDIPRDMWGWDSRTFA